MNPDFSDTTKIANRMGQAVKKLQDMAQAVGAAKQVLEYNAEMRRVALSVEVVKALKAGESATAAEHIARASEAYQAKLNALAAQCEAAHGTVAEYKAADSAFEASRSLLSWSKESMRQLE